MPLFRKVFQERLEFCCIRTSKMYQRSSFSSELLGFFKMFFLHVKKDLLQKKHRTLFPIRIVTGCDLVPLCCVFFRQFGNGKKLRSRCCLNAPIFGLQTACLVDGSWVASQGTLFIPHLKFQWSRRSCSISRRGF